MNEVDNEILVRSNGYVTLKRIMGDYFSFLTSMEPTSKRLLETANGINDAIEITLEVQNNNQLSFLDTLVRFDSQTKTFSTTFYMKPIHSKCITLGKDTDQLRTKEQSSWAKQSELSDVLQIPSLKSYPSS